MNLKLALIIVSVVAVSVSAKAASLRIEKSPTERTAYFPNASAWLESKSKPSVGIMVNANGTLTQCVIEFDSRAEALSFMSVVATSGVEVSCKVANADLSATRFETTDYSIAIQ